VTQLKVVQKDGEEIPTEVLAREIQAISDGIKRLRAGRLNDRALILLIQHAAPSVKYKPVTIAVVRSVLRGIETLAAEYLKREEQKA